MLIYASSSPDYFAEHGEAFIRSAERHGHQVMVDMIADFPEWRDHFESDAVYAGQLRWMRLPELLVNNDVFVCDIDSIFNKSIEFFGCDMALFFRPLLKEHMKVLLTASYWNKTSRPFAEKLRDRLLEIPYTFSDDQRWAWRLFKRYGKDYKVVSLTQDLVCYNFDRDAPIWTCKGPNRKSDPVYLARRAEYA